MRRFLSFLSLLVLCCSQVNASPTLEDYGSLPDIRDLTLSPSGKRIAGIADANDKQMLCVFELEKNTSDCFVDVSGLKTHGVTFAGEDRAILVTSQRGRGTAYARQTDFGSAYTVNLKSRKVSRIPGLGRVIGISEDGSKVYVPAFDGGSAYDLYAASTDKSQDITAAQGSSDTLDWLISSDGTPLLREDYSDRNNLYTLRSNVTGKWETIFSRDAEIRNMNVVGITMDEKHAVVSDSSSEPNYRALYSMDLATGKMGEPLFYKEGRDADSVLTDSNRVVYGVQYSGMTPSYEFFDEALTAEVQGIVDAFDLVSVQIVSWSSDWNSILFYLSGNGFAGKYVRYDRNNKSYRSVTNARQNFTGEDVAPVSIIEYQTRDELKISAIVTWPLGMEDNNEDALPFIVMPHGGPRSYDQVGFDWMAQFFASRGYAVLQPNFRGSTGFGRDFELAGNGEWGKAMQNDVTDGLTAVVKLGWADPERICIVGWSYGGYAALAGGAFTPEKYKCVVSIAGVSDLHRTLSDDRREVGETSSQFAYWSKLIGDIREDRGAIEAISPAYHAGLFRAPVLLIHGFDDGVVPFLQSHLMETALKEAGKPVRLVRINGQDHGLSTKGARSEALSEIINFVDEAIGD